MPKTILDTPHGPTPMGPYSIAVEAGGFVFVSGQVAVDSETGLPVAGDVAAQTRQVMRTIGAVLGDVGLGYEDIVKTTIFLADIADFPVVNPVYREYVGSTPPARSTVEVSALPGDFLVEIEVIAAR
jgi:2-iminobutanoate/2-iminopropanoate deaminase